MEVIGERNRQGRIVGILQPEREVPHVCIHTLLPHKLRHGHPFGTADMTFTECQTVMRQRDGRGAHCG
ncbi:hypothetical protein GCM10010353_65060 [Streptomyces chryseus]|nr:hypothetical protein GCM10010353_65060 [Streptomyces chryseus]